MPRFFAFEIHCEEMNDPPVLAVFAITPIDQAKSLRLDEPQVSSTFLQVDGDGVMASADVKHSDVEVLTSVLFWNKLEDTSQ